MPNRKFLNQLDEMKGKTFDYGNQIHCIIDYTADDQKEKVIIKTNLTVFDRKYEAVSEFLSYWKPVGSVPAVVSESNSALDVFVEKEQSMADSLIAILQDNIAKVQADKNYIGQAQAINGNVNSIINIQKMKMDMVRQMKKK